MCSALTIVKAHLSLKQARARAPVFGAAIWGLGDLAIGSFRSIVMINRMEIFTKKEAELDFAGDAT